MSKRIKRKWRKKEKKVNKKKNNVNLFEIEWELKEKNKGKEVSKVTRQKMKVSEEKNTFKTNEKMTSNIYIKK